MTTAHRTTRRQVEWTFLLAAPIVVGGAAAILLGAWDYVPWLTSPTVWLGVLVSALIGAWLVRTQGARPRDVAVGIVVGMVAFGLGLLVVFAGVILVWVVWRPLG